MRLFTRSWNTTGEVEDLRIKAVGGGVHSG